MGNNSSKVLIICIGIILLANSLFMPKKAEAIIPVSIDASIPLIVAVDIPATINFSETIARWAKDDLVKGLRDVVSKRILDYIVDQTVKWVQGGGEPKYVTDWQGFLKDAGNIAFDSVVRDVGAARLCAPFALQLKLALLPVQRFPTQISCTLDQFTANINNFYDNFSNGGWAAYDAMWQPQNNYYGQILMIQDQLQTETSRRLTAAANEAIAGNGFLNVKKCIERAPVSAGRAGFETEGECIRWETTTPGSIVGQALGTSITADTWWAANIQSWTTALVNAVINRVIGEGVGAIRSGFSGNSGSYTSGNYSSYYYPPEYQAAANTEIRNQNTGIATDFQSFLNEKKYLLSDKQKSLTAAQQIVSALQNMQGLTCSNPVSAGEVANAQSEVTRLTNDVVVLTGDVNNLQSGITQINQSTSGIASSGTFGAYQQIYNQYNTSGFRGQILDGTARSAADQEFAAKQALLTETQVRLAQCGAQNQVTP